MKTFLILMMTALISLPSFAASMFDLTFNFGPSLSQSGNIQDLGDPNLNTGLGFNYFFRPNHGVGFNFTSEYNFEGEGQFRAINDASISTFDFHYAYRHIIKKLHIVFEPGLGWQTLYDKSLDPYWGYFYYNDLSTSFILDYKLFLRYVLKEWDSGINTSSGSFFLGLGIIQIFSLNDDLYGHDISGSRLSGLFQIGVGW